jgi:hypothetical protein
MKIFGEWLLVRDLRFGKVDGWGVFRDERIGCDDEGLCVGRKVNG